MRIITAIITTLTLAQVSSAKYCSVSSKDKYANPGIVSSNPDIEGVLAFMSDQPLAYWYTDRSGDLNSAKSDLKSFVDRCKNDPPIVVIYGIPGKDCAHSESSSGFNKDDSSYDTFLSNAKSILPKDSIVIIEPDALALSIDNCGSNLYPSNLKKAISYFPEGYIDIGHWKVIYDKGSAVRSKVSELDPGNKLKGYSLNLSNYRKTSEMETACRDLVSGTSKKCVIDTSRNNNGPDSDNTWCNYKGAGIGMSGGSNDVVDQYVWIKPAAELDGSCYGSSRSYQSSLGAGSFDINWLKILWSQGYYASTNLSQPTPAAHPSQPTSQPTSQSASSFQIYNGSSIRICRQR